jgi:hypothetical protein
MEPNADRITTFRAFEKRFRKERFYPAPSAPLPIAPEVIDEVEQALVCRMPKSYREFMTTVGPCSVRGLNDSWLFNHRDDVPVPFETLWSPWAIVQQCEYEWLAPIPAELTGGSPAASEVAWKFLLPFAVDGGGNWHCFRRQSADVDDAPIYYFDHDGGAIDCVASGLEELIRVYMRLPGY